ncbi:MAG TPA: energy transducer TonB [Terriglobales bacterium]|jgi:TonB family protein|nr:energy transducer TonB [Terriglobales bacterium]
MNREQLAEELDRQIDALMQANLSEEPAPPDWLAPITRELRLLPNEQFHARLKQELLEQAESLESSDLEAASEILPSLRQEALPSFSTRQIAVLPADPRSLFLSFLSHAALVALIASGVWVGHVTLVEKRSLAELTYTPLPPGDTDPKGGGGGGDRSTLRASRGTPPKFSEEQLAPPAILVHVEKPKLQADASVLGPPVLKLPQSKQLGDLLSPNAITPSNGTGNLGGIGDRSGTGIGTGRGAGVGPGDRLGYGGGFYRSGNGVTAPRVLYNPDPEYSDEARRVKYQGNVVLSLVVDPTGTVRQVRVAHSLGMGLDEKAMEAVQKWRFAPGMKDGRPVAVEVNVEVSFRLY